MYPAGVAAALLRTLNDNPVCSNRVIRNQVSTSTALKNQVYRKYDQEFWTGQVQPSTGIITVVLLNMYAHSYKQLGQITDGVL